jgi:hypothetical protein
MPEDAPVIHPCYPVFRQRVADGYAGRLRAFRPLCRRATGKNVTNLPIDRQTLPGAALTFGESTRP